MPQHITLPINILTFNVQKNAILIHVFEEKNLLTVGGGGGGHTSSHVLSPLDRFAPSLMAPLLKIPG